MALVDELEWVMVVGFGFNALMLVHETNQPPSYFNDSGDTYGFLVWLDSLPFL